MSQGYLEGEDKPCWVRVDGTWREGFILGDWYQSEGRWRARVEWSDGPGLNHRTSFWAEDLRPWTAGESSPRDAEGDAGRGDPQQ